MIAVPTTSLRLFDDRDVVWIGHLLDLVEGSLGAAWRVLLERVAHAPLRAAPSRIAAILSALRRVTGGRGARARLARRVRALVLGHPALDQAARIARLAAAAAALEIDVGDVERLLWADLARERPVALPNGRPEPSLLAAYANLDRLQREIRRAHALEIRVWRDAHELVRAARRYGLATTITRTPDTATVVRFAGPLSVVHATTVYGRALGAVIPALAAYDRFTLDLCLASTQVPSPSALVSSRGVAHGSEVEQQPLASAQVPSLRRVLRVEPPVWLPAAPAPGGKRPSIAERLGRALRAAGFAVDHEPAPVATGDRLLYPDLAIDHAGTRTYVEIIGFATADHLTDQLAAYRAAGTRVIVCLDARRSPRDIADPQVVRFERTVDARVVARRLAAP